MAIKILSAQWEELQHENVKLRDKARKRFYKELGIKPASRVSEIGLAPGSRNSNMQSLIAKAKSGREGDGDLRAINTLAAQSLASYTPGFRHMGGLSLAYDFASQHPKALREFFLSDDLTTFEIAKVKD